MSAGRDGMFNIGKKKGHSLDFSQWIDHGRKRHYWGIPNKNIGFYTSEQLLEVERRYKILKTEGCQSFAERYQTIGDIKYIVDKKQPSQIHCCTCHNNPKRYINGRQFCDFCNEYRKRQKQHSLAKLKQYFLEYNRSLNPQYDTIPSSGSKLLQEKSIQVELKLPSIKRHNNKYPSSCDACKEKQSDIRIAKNAKRIVTQTAQKKHRDSLLYSFSTKKKDLKDYKF